MKKHEEAKYTHTKYVAQKKNDTNTLKTSL